MRRLFPLLSSLALAIPAAPAVPIPAAPEAIGETKDRLPPETMAALVAGPIRIAEKGDLAGAERSFERLLEKGRRQSGARVREADLLMSFGVRLFTRGGDLDREDMRKLSLPYVVRAVAATKSAFGLRHPETAVALHTYADLLVELRGEPPPEESERALEEALSIRVETLGPNDHETLAAMRALARTKAARFESGGNLDQAARLMRQAIEVSERSAPPEDYLQPASLRFELAKFYAKAGRIDEAVREARIAAEAAREPGTSEEVHCLSMEIEAAAIAAEIEAERPAEAEKLRRSLEREKNCLEILERLKSEPATR